MQLKQLPYAKQTHKYLTLEELKTLPLRDEIVMDTECYGNYWLFAIKHLHTGKVFTLELSPDVDLDRNTLLWVMYRFTVITFNGNSYDLPMVWAAYSGASLWELQRFSDELINEDKKREKENKLIAHIDIIEVLPGKASQKLYAGRLHTKRMQSLPYEPGISLTREQAEYLKDYCLSDLDDLEHVYNSIRPQLELRKEMSKRYGVDLMSKSDAQIAETVIVSETAKVIGYRPRRPKFNSNQVLSYTPPSYLSEAPTLTRQTVDFVSGLKFTLDKQGSPVMPTELTDYCVRIGAGNYRLGMGGLHSSEKNCYHVAEEGEALIDRDVTSYYPAIILNNKLYPKQLTLAFLDVYRSIVERRIKAKKENDKVTADSLKITINGSFGKFGSMYSNLYSPDLLLAVTITGQLSLLCFIEMMELSGITVISANTDGVVMKVKDDQKTTYAETLWAWENLTGFKTEEIKYKGLYSRSVNDYFAIGTDGDIKRKGFFAKDKLDKSPKFSIAKEAVIELMTNRTPLRETIYGCKDITKFLCVRTVNGGAHKEGWYLGKAVRWYYANGVKGTLRYITSGNAVPESEGAKPLMELPDLFPEDIDYERYVLEAEKILKDIGWQQLTLF